jgi:transcriptional regulator with XRE-family HTH domain
MITGENLRKLRHWKDMKQQTVANKMHISQPRYYKLEQKKNLSHQIVTKALSALSITPEDLKRFDLDPPPPKMKHKIFASVCTLPLLILMKMPLRSEWE